MKHARQTIREAVATTLAAITGVTIYTSRAYPRLNPPVISVYGNDEESSSENDSMPATIRYSRRLALNIEIAVSAATEYDNLVDNYAAQVEALMAADLTLDGTATDSVLRRTTLKLNGEMEKAVAIATLTYEVWYRTLGTDPENAL
jgi:hypothetical protein